MHGKVDMIKHDFQGLFIDMPQNFIATRYHSLIVSDSNFPKELMVTSRSSTDNYIMGVRHTKYPVFGFQFHPESYKTEDGHLLIKNFYC